MNLSKYILKKPIYPLLNDFDIISAKSYKTDLGKKISGPITSYLHGYWP